MTDPSTTDSPTPGSLLKATAIASGLAIVLLVLVVLPAEYNIDVTGFGRTIGLTVLSAPTPAPEPDPGLGPVEQAASRDDRTELEIPPGKGLEYKFLLRAGEKLTYSWWMDSGELLYDFHGEPRGAAEGVFQSYATGVASSVKGILTTPFEGTHGWYWKNMGAEPMKVTLETSGAYKVLGVR